jgi:hypothetical protein
MIQLWLLRIIWLAEFLLEGKTQDPMEYCGLDIIEYQPKVSPDLRETPFLDWFKLFVGYSSKMIQGKTHNGSSVVDGERWKVTELGRLPNWLAHTCEVFALNQTLKFLKDKEGSIYTDSKFAFGVVHTFGKNGQKGD